MPRLPERLRVGRRRLLFLLLAAAALVTVTLLAWRWQTGARLNDPQFLYIGWEGDGPARLFRRPVHGDNPLALTPPTYDVFDYALAPDNDRIAYSTRRPDGQTGLWLVDRNGDGGRQLLDCGPVPCSSPVWVPGGRRLLYERRPLDDDGVPGSTELWWLDPEDGTTVPLFAEDPPAAIAPAFSSDGEWLSYLVPAVQELHAYHLESGRTVIVPDSAGDPPSWHPRWPFLLTGTFVYTGEQFATHLYRLTLPDVELLDFSGDLLQTNDGSAAWSPDGRHIAFGRSVARTSAGRQLWLMDGDGSNPRPLTDDPGSNFGRPVWAPDGQSLLTQRFPVNQPGARPGIWLLDLEDDSLQELVSPAIQPTWLPTGRAGS